MTIASVERDPLCLDAEGLLAATRTVVRVGGPDLLLFCVVDEHAHNVANLDRAAAGSMARRLARSLGALLPVDLAPARFRKVDGRPHLKTLVTYVLQQPLRHGLQHAGHVALWPGSCFVDLVGARLLEGFDPRRLAAALPRLGRDDLYEAVSLQPVAPLCDDDVRAEGPRRIGDAAAAALGIPILAGSSALVVRGRRAAGRLCRDLGLPDAQTAFALRCPVGTASRLARSAPPDPALDRAIRRQLALRRAAGVPMEAAPFAAASLSPPPNRKGSK